MTRALAAGLLAAVLAAGCDSGPKIVPVSGVVMIDGKPLTHGKIQVVPANARPAYATIGPDGRFTLTTTTEGDGVAVGTHPVAIIAHENTGPGAQRWHAPKKYIASDKSGLTMTVDGPKADMVVNISWDGGKPFVEQMGKE